MLDHDLLFKELLSTFFLFNLGRCLPNVQDRLHTGQCRGPTHFLTPALLMFSAYTQEDFTNLNTFFLH